MPRATRIAFEEVDRNDPTLAVDGLSDFLPAENELDDPTLAVSTLGDFFTERAAEGEDHVPDYFEAATEAVTTAAPEEPQPAVSAPVAFVEDDAEVFASEPFFDGDGILEADAARHSDIQRAAIEFQAFAEKFHAFAAECAQR